MKIYCTEQEKQHILEHCCIRQFGKEKEDCKWEFGDNSVCVKCFSENDVEVVVEEN